MKKFSLVFLSISGITMLAGCVNTPISSNKFFVSFVANGAHESIPTQCVSEGKYATEPETPTRDGYTFKQWCSDSALTEPFNFKKDRIISDTTLYADWGNIKKYEVHFFIDNEEQTALTQRVPYGQKVTRPDTPTKDYYIFDGWYTNQKCTGQPYAFDSPLIDLGQPLYLYGKFNPIPDVIKVTYIANGGTITGEDYEYVSYGDSIDEEPVVNKEDCTCVGWYTDNGTFSNQFIFGTTSVTEPISLYAKWEQTTFNIKWLNYDQTPLLDSKIDKGEPVKYTGLTPRKLGNCFTSYSFTGWLPEPESAATKDQIHVAQYEAKSMNDVFYLEANVKGNYRIISITLVGGTAEVDWGDGTTEVVNHANKASISHIYKQDGVYEIRVVGVTGIDKIDAQGASFITRASLNNHLYLESDLRGFAQCSSLKEINIPDSVTSIGEQAFSDCSSLSSIIIPDKVTSIGSNAFEGCSSLTIYCESETKPEGWDINWNSSNCPCYWGYISHGTEGDYDYVRTTSGMHLAKYNGIDTSATVPSQLLGYTVSHLDYTFEDNESVQSVTLPNSIISIGINTFNNCSSLSSINIPINVASIGNNAFEGCSSLPSITLSPSLQEIGKGAFMDCSSLSKVYITNNVSLISGADGMFEGCPKSLVIYVPNNLIDDYKNDPNWNIYKLEGYSTR